jgi:hypothetical protein
MTSSVYSKLMPTTLTFAALCTTLTIIPPAEAAWESIGGCPSSNFVVLKASDNRPLKVNPGFTGEIEIYGHLLDMVRDVGKSVSGITGSTVSFVRGTGGFENGGSGVVGRKNTCNLGSIIVKVSIPRTSTANQRGTLSVGGERIPVQVVTSNFSVGWDGKNDSASLSPGTQEQVEAQASNDLATLRRNCRAAAETRFPQCVANRPAIEAERAQECAQRQAERDAAVAARRAEIGNSNSVAVGGPSPISACQRLLSCDTIRINDLRSCDGLEPMLSNVPPTPRTPRCLRELGGSSLFLADGTLEITLPPVSRATDVQLQTCLARGFDVSVNYVNVRGDYSTSRCGSSTVQHQHRLEAGRQTGGLTMRVAAQTQNDCNSKALLTLPVNARQSVALRGTVSGTVAVRHSVGGTTNATSPHDLGESTTTLSYSVVTPSIQLIKPLNTSPLQKIRSF